MASGHVSRANRPNTWPHRPMLLRRKSPCQLGPSTQSGHVIVPNPFGCWALTKIECTEDRGGPFGFCFDRMWVVAGRGPAALGTRDCRARDLQDVLHLREVTYGL